MTKFGLLSATALRTCFAATAIGFAAAPTWAQETQTPSEATEEAAEEPTTPDEAADEPQTEDTIVVTGTRLRTVTPFNSPDPITVIDPALSAKEGKTDLATTLQSSPIAAGSTQITSALSSNFVTNGGPGAQTIDLRGLGANRTLVLLNGRRAGPAGTRGGVSSFDLNVLPQSLAQNVQILKTGASSVYGSDAIAGVVNIITKTNFEGLQLDGNVSVPFDSGGESYRANIIWGKSFAGGRGNITLAADYSHVNELARGDRSYLACPEAYTFRQDGSRADLIDPRTGEYKCEDLRWGHVWTYDRENQRRRGPGNLFTTTGQYTGPINLIQFQYPGENLGLPGFASRGLFPFAAPPGWFATGYDTASLAVQNSYHPFVEEQSIIPETDLYTGYLQGSFEITDSIELFGEFLYNRRKTYQNGWRQFWSFGGTYDFYGTIWAEGWEGWNWLSPTGITNHSDSSQKVDYYRGVSGLRGDFGGDKNWKWDTHVQYSKSVGRYRTEQILQDVYDVASFQTSSCVGTTLPRSGKACIDLPWTDPYFLAGQMTPEQIDFMFDWEEGKTVYKQLSGEAVLSGDLFELPAGPLGVAVGVTVRRDSIHDVPGELTQAGNAWGASKSGITAGKSITKEAFGEVSIPVLKDFALAKEFTLSAAGRVTNVEATRDSDGESSKSNGNWTYKIGGNWAVNDTIRFRASYGTSFRAPALFEQFLEGESSFVPQRLDPCINVDLNLARNLISQRTRDNCIAAGIPGDYPGGAIDGEAFAEGGLGFLEPETSKAMVIGGILTPRFASLPDTTFSLAVDYFDIKVQGEITQLGASNILRGCYDSQNFASEPLCELITRVPPGGGTEFNILTITDPFINIASQRNSGIDVALVFRQGLNSWGTLSFIGDMTFQLKDDFKLLPTSPETSDNGEVGSPKFVGDFRLSWTNVNKDWNVFYGINVIGKTSELDDFLDANAGNRCVNSVTRGRYCPKLNTPTVFYHNLSVTKEIAEDFSITLGINNLFDTRPPRVSVLNLGQISMLGPVVAASQYSFLGRRGFINVSSKF